MAKIVLRKEEVRGLLLSEGVEQLCKSYADAAVARAGAGYESDTYSGRNRVNASVRAVTFKARKDNMQNNTLLKAIK